MCVSYDFLASGIFCVLFSGVAIQGEDHISDLHLPSIAALVILGACLIFIMISLSLQPVSRVKLTFKVE